MRRSGNKPKDLNHLADLVRRQARQETTIMWLEQRVTLIMWTEARILIWRNLITLFQHPLALCQVTPTLWGTWEEQETFPTPTWTSRMMGMRAMWHGKIWRIKRKLYKKLTSSWQHLTQELEYTNILTNQNYDISLKTIQNNLSARKRNKAFSTVIQSLWPI